jgi:hypothetical protein
MHPFFKLIPILLILVGTTHSSLPPSDRSQQKKPATSKQETTGHAPSGPVITVPENQAKPSEKENRPKAETQHRLEKPPWWDVTWGTWGLVIVGFFGTLAAVWTLVTIHRQTNALISSERAWVLVEIGEAPMPTTGDAIAYWIMPVVKNHGKTSARIVKMALRQHQVAQPDSLPLVPEYRGEQSYNFILPPGLPIRPMSIGLISEDLNKIRELKTFLYVYGFVDYLDVGNVKRQTRFCYLYHVPVGGDPAPAGFYMSTQAPLAYTQCT